MRTRFQITVINSSRSGSHATFYLETDLPFAYHPELALEHPTWHEPMMPLSVSFSFEERLIFVMMPMQKVNSDESLKSHIDMYRAHGWRNILDD